MIKLLKFSSSWCASCKNLSESLRSVDLSGVEFREIDIDEETEITNNLNIRGLPTLVIKDSANNELSRKVGALNATQINNWLEEYRQ